METYLFSLEAVSGLLVEYHKGGNLETGGILVGPKNRKIVTDIIPSSAFAERETCTYYQSEQDIRILNRELRRFQAIGREFLGYYHSHPMGLCQLSQGDIATCSAILQDPSYKINNRLVMCILTTTNQHNFPIFSYVVSFNGSRKIAVQNTGIKVLPKHCIEECMDCFVEESSFRNEPLFIPTPQKEEETTHEESNHSGQDSKPTEKPEPGKPVRSSGKRKSNRKLSGKKKRA